MEGSTLFIVRHDSKVAVLHGTEPWGQCNRSRTNYGPDEWESWLRSQKISVKRASIREIETGNIKSRYKIVINPFGEDYPEEDHEKAISLTRIVDYAEQGGIFVCTGGWPFYYANCPRGRIADGSRLKRFFHIEVDTGQWWEDFEPVKQPKISIAKYGELAHKGGTYDAHIWRPVLLKYGAVEKILISTRRPGIAIGFLSVGNGGIVLTGMSLRDSAEFDKLASFLEILLKKISRGNNGKFKI